MHPATLPPCGEKTRNTARFGNDNEIAGGFGGLVPTGFIASHRFGRAGFCIISPAPFAPNIVYYRFVRLVCPKPNIVIVVRSAPRLISSSSRARSCSGEDVGAHKVLRLPPRIPVRSSVFDRTSQCRGRGAKRDALICRLPPQTGWERPRGWSSVAAAAATATTTIRLRL